MGRKTKLTPELEAEIVGNVRKGLSNKAACRMAGIGETTFYRWLQCGATAKSEEVLPVLPVPERGRSGFQDLEPRRHPAGPAVGLSPSLPAGINRTRATPWRSSRGVVQSISDSWYTPPLSLYHSSTNLRKFA